MAAEVDAMMMRFPDVSDSYITAMGIPLRAGRDISPHDTPSGEPSAARATAPTT